MENKEYVFKGTVINGFVMLFITIALFMPSNLASKPRTKGNICITNPPF